MPSRYDQYKVTVTTAFSAQFWNSTFGDIDSRISAVEELSPKINSAINNVTQVGLDRINTILGPALQSIIKVQDLGFLIANSNTSVMLSVGLQPTFILSNSDQISTFTPSPFVALTRTSNYTDFAVARTVSYNKSLGAYVCQVIQIFGNAGAAAYSDWVIAGTAGVVVAESQMLAAAQAAATASQASAVAAAQTLAATTAVMNRFTVSSNAPTGGNDGDIWFKI